MIHDIYQKILLSTHDQHEGASAKFAFPVGTLRTDLSKNEDMVPIGPARRRQEFVSPGPSHQPVLTLLPAWP